MTARESAVDRGSMLSKQIPGALVAGSQFVLWLSLCNLAASLRYLHSIPIAGQAVAPESMSAVARALTACLPNTEAVLASIPFLLIVSVVRSRTTPEFWMVEIVGRIGLAGMAFLGAEWIQGLGVAQRASEGPLIPRFLLPVVLAFAAIPAWRTRGSTGSCGQTG